MTNRSMIPQAITLLNFLIEEFDLDLDTDEIEAAVEDLDTHLQRQDTCPIDIDMVEVLILDDPAMETAWDDSLQSYLDDCLLDELPEIARRYFDEEAWKRDARMDGVGHSLSSYDGNHHEVGGYNIFRTN